MIDVGSNTLKVLVFERTREGALAAVGERVCETRLGGGGARLAEATMAAGVATVAELAAWAGALGAEEIAVVATAAVRAAENGAEFVAAVQAATGLAMQVLSGEEEARLIGLGLRQDPALAGWENFVQLDQGGGSLELIEHTPTTLAQAVSLPLGAVRVTRRCVPEPALPLARAVRQAVTEHAEAVLAAADFLFPVPARPLVATGGGLVAAAHLLGGQEQAVVTRAQMEALAQELADVPVAERVARGVDAGRADILPAGLLVVLAVMARAGVTELRTSTYNLRWGVAAAWAAGRLP